MENDISEKEEALRRFLGIGDNVKITSDDDDKNFTVNSQRVLSGTTPDEYVRCVQDFKQMLTKGDIEKISKFIRYGTKDSKKKDKLYDQISKKAKGESFSIEKVFSSPSNVLYWLLKGEDQEYNKETTLSLREAWKGQKVKDRRTEKDKDDGEYMVLTDGEADDYADDYLDVESWKSAIQNDNTTASYKDWKETVISVDGRGHLLSTYDGSENEIEINGTTYYIYRTG